MGDALPYFERKRLVEAIAVCEGNGCVVFHPDDIPGDGPLAYDEASGRMVRMEAMPKIAGSYFTNEWWRFPAGDRP